MEWDRHATRVFRNILVMCCRYLLLRAHLSELLERLGVRELSELSSRYNIAPGSKIPLVRTKSEVGSRELTAVRWGLVPAWSKQDGLGAGLINARAETLTDKPSFRAAFRARRCLIPASGFYEWKVVGGTRQPWLFQRRDGQPFFLAGLWEAWGAPDGISLETCAVITTEPNELMQPIHYRMPAILTVAMAGPWLDPTSQPEALAAEILQPFPADQMMARPVSSRVNSVANDDEACLSAVVAGAKPDDGQLAWNLGDDA
jgi:putative SOS response-associated peptidase YedK